jgi:aquaglyceroporin related protein
MAGRRQHTAADFRPPRLQHQDSSAASSIGRYATQHPENIPHSRPEHDRNNTAPMRMRRTGTSRTNQTNQTGGLHDAHERSELKREPTVDIENEYFALNPWYNQQKAKPVFGLASPLPRTVRKGMWWGRGDLRKSMYKVDEEQDDDGVDRNDGLDFAKEEGQ